MTSRHEKWFTAVTCILGVAAVGIGMETRNNVVFLIGIVLVAVGYLVIRKKLKSTGLDDS